LALEVAAGPSPPTADVAVLWSTAEAVLKAIGGALVGWHKVSGK
jgi:hypothetical protein